ncbi:hypothetical protein CAEBREN_28473 [Caenorhabditis brenneri]|uniref:Uncharacterized protein n=1 Tax=Caenorhabditis brenneri TaxID=135651 RepID=G0PHK1_CAEBE|nr:hypothetical protein CAEBREN_28473 [Caenorhabditis brenneri]
MVKRKDEKPPLPTTPLPPPVGTLPVQYKRMSASRTDPPPPPSNKMYMLIPMLICASLIWFAWSQWHDPPQVQQQPVKVEDHNKPRVWWMPDLLKTLPPFADGYRLERFVPKYKISGCSINGNFPEINAAIFCYLRNSTLFTEANKTISQDIVENGDKKCFNCQENVGCFMRKLIKEHEKVAEGLAGHVRTYLTNHFSPQSWNCHFNRHLTTISTVKIGGTQKELAAFSDKLNKILGEQGVAPEVQKVIKEEVLKIPLELSQEERQIMEKVKKDEDLFRIFRYLYEHDYMIFGYDF